MTISDEDARGLARLLIDIRKTKRDKIIWCLDSVLRCKVLEEIGILQRDMPLEFADTLPPGRIPNCS